MLYFLANQVFHNCISRLTILSVMKPVGLCLYFRESYFWCNVTVCICVHFYFIPPYWFTTGSWNPSARKTMTQTRFYHHDDVMIWNKFPCYWPFHIFSEQTVEKWVDFTVICPTMTLVWPYIYYNVNDCTIIQVLLVGAMQRVMIVMYIPWNIYFQSKCVHFVNEVNLPVGWWGPISQTELHFQISLGYDAFVPEQPSHWLNWSKVERCWPFCVHCHRLDFEVLPQVTIKANFTHVTASSLRYTFGMVRIWYV